VPLEIHRIDDRYVHGQVVVGWGQAYDIGFIVVVDDELAESPWEQDLYRMAAPPEMALLFSTVADAPAQYAAWAADKRPGLLITGDVATMRRLADAVPAITRVNVGGVHGGAGRTERTRYVFLGAAEEAELRTLAAHGVEVTARDLPSARPVPLDDLLAAGHHA
jgi:mannose/fructose/N-acetylgalactosamine-specific phosphotransferase system component IIB